MALRVAVIDDQQDDRDFIRTVLEERNLEVVPYNNENCPLADLSEKRPDIIILDQKMPRLSGVELMKQIRAQEGIRAVPIIMLTGVSDEDEKINAFDSGADDYLVKPFSPRELVARISAIHRRRTNGAEDVESIQYRDLKIDTKAHDVRLGNQAIHLTYTEYNILTVLMRAKGAVVSRDKLRETALVSLNVTDRTIDVHMASLRKKLQNYGNNIETVRSVGYRFRFSDN